jgi:hypothetical protein
MNKRPNKRQLRTELEQEISAFLRQGGTVQDIPRGASGMVDGRYSHALSFDRNQGERTPLTDVIKTIEQRREEKRKSLQPKPKKPQQKILYDDFGEPIRVLWEN